MLNLFGRGKKQERRRVAEDALLTRYLKPSKLPSERTQETWEDSLGKTYKKAVRGLVRSGLLRRPTVGEGLQCARVKDIKPVLRELDLKVSGRKPELMERLLEDAPDEAQKLATKCAQDALVVTEAGRDRALSFQQERQGRREEAEQKAHEALKGGKMRAACDAVNEFFRWLPSPMRPGLNMQWDDPRGGVHGTSRPVKHILKEAAGSWVVSELPAELREKILLYAAEDMLWPDGLVDDKLDEAWS
jgi:hypothetical protein